jgi:hypothetical protein
MASFSSNLVQNTPANPFANGAWGIIMSFNNYCTQDATVGQVNNGDVNTIYYRTKYLITIADVLTGGKTIQTIGCDIIPPPTYSDYCHGTVSDAVEIYFFVSLWNNNVTTKQNPCQCSCGGIYSNGNTTSSGHINISYQRVDDCLQKGNTGGQQGRGCLKGGTPVLTIYKIRNRNTNPINYSQLDPYLTVNPDGGGTLFNIDIATLAVPYVYPGLPAMPGSPSTAIIPNTHGIRTPYTLFDTISPTHSAVTLKI